MFRWLWFQIFPGFEKNVLKIKSTKASEDETLEKQWKVRVSKFIHLRQKILLVVELTGSLYYIFQQITSKIRDLRNVCFAQWKIIPKVIKNRATFYTKDIEEN